MLQRLGQGLNHNSPKDRLPVAAPFAWWDFSDLSTLTLSGSNIQAVSNKSGNGHTLTTPASDVPFTSGVGATFTGSSRFVCSSSGSTFNFMHNSGGNGTAIMVVRTSSERNATVLSTLDTASGERGFELGYNTFGTNSDMRFTVHNGSTSFGATSGDTYSTEEWHIAVFRKRAEGDNRYHDYNMVIDNSWAIEAQNNGSPSDLDAASALTIGSRGNRVLSW